MKNLIKLASLALIATAPVCVAENKDEYEARYNEAIKKQTAERVVAFNQQQIQKDPALMAKMIIRQREAIMKLQAEKKQHVR